MTVLTKILMFANTASVKGKLILIDVNFNCDETHKIVKKERIARVVRRVESNDIRDSKKFDRFFKVEKSQGEVYRLKARLENAQGEQESLRDEYDRAQASVARLHSERDKAIAELEKTQEELERTQATLGKAQLQQDKLQNLLDKTQSEVDKLQEKLDKTQTEIRRVSPLKTLLFTRASFL